MTDFRTLVRLLAHNSVEFIIIGGAAATAHGSANRRPGYRLPAHRGKHLSPDSRSGFL